MISTASSNYPEILKTILLPILELLPFFHQMERNEMEKLYRGSYIDAYCQVWFPLAKLFQRRRLKHEKVNGQTTDAK
jgi:hypothetical protein